MIVKKMEKRLQLQISITHFWNDTFFTLRKEDRDLKKEKKIFLKIKKIV